MPHKQILFRSAAREKILRGTTQLADAIRVTLGPRSKSVLIEKKWGVPIVCNDGVTIAKEFDLRDAEENLGARMLRQAAEKTGDMVGDGTSTSTILAHAIFADGVRNVVAGASAIDIKRGLDRATKRAIEALRALSRPVATRRKNRRLVQSPHTTTLRLASLSQTQWRRLAARGLLLSKSRRQPRPRST
jgi:chaperonin GroEL